MPFLAPPTEQIDSEITCTLVFYPSGDEYRRALFGQIADLTDAWNWEASREDQAAIRQVWLTAYLQTLECNDMGCLDDIIALLEEIRDKDVCCDSVEDLPGGEDIGGVDDSTLPPDVDRDGGTLPPDWVGDPDGYDAYLCGQAHRLAETTDDAVDAVFNTILLASNVVVFATLLVLAFGNVIGMAIAAVLAGGYTLVTWSEIFGFFSAFTELRELLGGGDPQGKVPLTKSELSAAYDDIVDAVFCSNDAGEAIAAMDAIIDANVTTPSYAALLKLTYRIALRPIFWGFGGAPDRFDCSCTVTPDQSFTYTFPSNFQGWGEVRGVWESPGRIRLNATSQSSYAFIDYDDFASRAGFSGNSYALAILTLDVLDSDNYPGGMAPPYQCQVTVYYQDGTNQSTVFDNPGTALAVTVDDTKLVKNTGTWIEVRHLSNGDTSDKSMEFDNVYIGVIAI